MKKLLFILVISTLNFSSVKAQTNVYHPFPTSKALWSELFIPQQGAWSRSQYAIFGDTVIGTNTYHKLYERSIPCGDTSMTAANSYLTGAIREDTSKRIFYRPFTGSCLADRKLYDFSKHIAGDTIKYDTTNFHSCFTKNYLVVNFVDSILIDHSYRTQYNFIGGEKWIEGIGSLNGLMSVIMPPLTCSCITANTCFLQNDSIYYYSKTYNYCLCNNYLGINDVIKEKEIIKIFPNPFSIQTSLMITEYVKNATLFVYNPIGQQVKQIKNVTGQTITIKRDNLSSGLYFINLTQDNKIIASSKLIIVD